MNITTAQYKQAEHAAAANRTVLGFWIYLMTDCVLFASLFATFVVMRGNVDGGPSGAQLFDMPYVLVETMLLLGSSFTCGLALLALAKRDKQMVIAWLLFTGLLGALFLGMELREFYLLAHEGNSWQRSGFLSSYFTLVGTHGLHITVGLMWLIALVIQLARKGLSGNAVKRLTLFSLFWHFLDVIWIFIFSVVYLWSNWV